MLRNAFQAVQTMRSPLGLLFCCRFLSSAQNPLRVQSSSHKGHVSKTHLSQDPTEILRHCSRGFKALGVPVSSTNLISLPSSILHSLVMSWQHFVPVQHSSLASLFLLLPFIFLSLPSANLKGNCLVFSIISQSVYCALVPVRPFLTL